MSKYSLRRKKRRSGTINQAKGNEEMVCPNCDHGLASDDTFCSNCGQRYTNGKISFKYVLLDFIENVFNIDSKFLKSTVALIRPGLLTNKFFEGKQNSYVTPLRLFFVSAVIHFAVISYVAEEKLALQMAPFIENNQKAAFQAPLIADLEEKKTALKSSFENSTVDAALDSLLSNLSTAPDSIEIPYLDPIGGFNFEFINVKIANKDLYDKDLKVLAESYDISEYISVLTFRQAVRVIRNVDNFGGFLIGKLIWMVLLMMPALAFLLKLLYIRRKRFYIEHLVFSFHYHALAFWLLSILLLISHFTNGWDNDILMWGYFWTFIFMLVYLYFAMKKVYRQSRTKTLIKFIILNISYVFVWSATLLLTLLVGALFY